MLEEKSQNLSIPIPTSVVVAKDSTLDSYRRVYPEWKPSTTLETTDVVGAIEAIAGMTCEFYFILIVHIVGRNQVGWQALKNQIKIMRIFKTNKRIFCIEILKIF